MKHEFLILYDYGQGGVWAFVKARSQDQIKRRFPAFEIVEEPPEWMTLETLDRLRERMTFDIDEPTGWLAEVAESRNGDDIATG